jgi:hypothetical protein
MTPCTCQKWREDAEMVTQRFAVTHNLEHEARLREWVVCPWCGASLESPKPEEPQWREMGPEERPDMNFGDERRLFEGEDFSTTVYKGQETIMEIMELLPTAIYRTRRPLEKENE